MPSLWMPDAPPVSPGAEDDEFADNSGGLPGGWTEVDHGAIQTVTEDAAGLKLLQATHAGSSLTGIYKAIPAGDFTYWCKLSLAGLANAATLNAGIALWQDAADAAGDIRAYTLRTSATQGEIGYHSYTAYNAGLSSVSGPFAITVDVGPTGIYLMVRRTGTTYAYSFSTDGIGWQRTFSTASLGITPLHIGPCMDNAASGADGSARFKFWRYLASDVGLTPLMSGDRVNVGVA